MIWKYVNTTLSVSVAKSKMTQKYRFFANSHSFRPFTGLNYKFSKVASQN